jgi:ribose transport system permease protein
MRPSRIEARTQSLGSQAHGLLAARISGSRQLALTLIAALLFIFFSVFAKYFFTLSNIYDMARVSTFTLIVGVGLTYLFIAAELDLSIGANLSFSGVIMALLITDSGINPWIAAIAALLTGTLIGVVNGFIATVIGVPSFIVTLGMLSVLGGGALVITGGLPVTYPESATSSFFAAANGTIFTNFPVQILWAVGIFAVGALALKFTPFGYHVYGAGGNAKAAHEMGINVRRVKFLCFVMTGALCGLAGALEGGWLREADPSSGDTFTLQTIAAVILGGVALYGGAGSVYGTLVGTIITGMLGNGLVLFGAQANWPQLLIGIIIITVAAMEVGLKRSDELKNTRLLRKIAALKRRPP